MTTAGGRGWRAPVTVLLEQGGNGTILAFAISLDDRQRIPLPLVMGTRDVDLAKRCVVERYYPANVDVTWRIGRGLK
jgi:hypothetical protein